MYSYTSADSIGLPHSSHSVTVSGNEGSRIELSGSTNGTCATIPAKSSGARLAIAPISRPPAEPPRATRRSAAVQPFLTSVRAHATKSVKVFRLVSILPSSYQRRPISPPPRTCAIAYTTPDVGRGLLGADLGLGDRAAVLAAGGVIRPGGAVGERVGGDVRGFQALQHVGVDGLGVGQIGRGAQSDDARTHEGRRDHDGVAAAGRGGYAAAA